MCLKARSIFISIPHEVGSAHIDQEEMILKAGEIKRLRSQFDFLVLLICRADRLKGSTPDRNQQLSELRARVCEAALTELGVPVDKTICIGDALAEGVSDLERGTAIYLVNKTAKPGTEVGKTASR